MIKVNGVYRDDVVRSAVATGVCDYRFAINMLVPLIDRFEEQRKLQSKKFYERLRRDIVQGCVMPPITLAFVNENQSEVAEPRAFEEYINAHIDQGYILDGLQRLNTLRRAESEAGFSADRPMLCNILIAERYDFLLYRMITINNGQRPMTARHQIEMLTGGVINDSAFEMKIVSEKETEGRKFRGAFRKSDISEAYIAFLSDSLHNQNSRIIESKLDEILVGKVMDSDIAHTDYSFRDVLFEIDRLQTDEINKEWLRNLNNLIGFAVAARSSLENIRNCDIGEFRGAIENFDEAFEAIDVSKVNVGKIRRDLSCHYLKMEGFWKMEYDELLSVFAEHTMLD